MSTYRRFSWGVDLAMGEPNVVDGAAWLIDGDGCGWRTGVGGDGCGWRTATRLSRPPWSSKGGSTDAIDSKGCPHSVSPSMAHGRLNRQGWQRWVRMTSASRKVCQSGCFAVRYGSRIRSGLVSDRSRASPHKMDELYRAALILPRRLDFTALP